MKILILGIGSAQVDAIKYLKEEGHTVFGISYRKEGAGLSLIDEFGLVNIIDKEAVLEYARKNDFHAIYSVGSDVAMPTASYVSERLQKPHFVSEKTAELLQDKVRFREFQKTHNIKPLPAKRITTIEDVADWDIFPAIIKPVDSQGQRGVYEVYKSEDIEKYLEKSLSFSRKKEVVLEKYVNGPELSVNAFFNKGKLITCIISTREVVENLPGGIVKGHETPANISIKLKQEINQIVTNLALKLDIKNGPFYLQMKYDETGAYVIEATPRLDGCHMWKLIEKSTGINLLALTFDSLLGNKLPDEIIPISIKSYKLDFMLMSPEEQFNSSTLSIHANTEEKKFYYADGEVVRPINGHIEKVGYQIYCTEKYKS